MKVKAIKEIIFWALSLLFAGVMFIGAIAELNIAPWAVGPVKIALFMVGFIGCTWASNKTSFGRRMAGDSF